MAHTEADILLSYLETVDRKFRDGVQRARHFYAIEGIHELRVEVKKRRAYLRLVEFLTPQFDAKPDLRPLRPLYESAGQLRDIDIQQALVFDSLERFQISEYANELKQVEFALRPALLAAINEFRVGTLTSSRSRVARSLRALSDDEIHAGLVRRLGQLTDQLASLLARRSHSEIELHDVRKVAKTFRYAIDVWQLIEGKSTTSNKSSASLKDVYTFLGDWHDVRVLTESVDKFLRRGAPRNLFDQSSYRKFVAELKSREANFLVQFRKASLVLREDLTRLRIEVLSSTRILVSDEKQPASRSRSAQINSKFKRRNK